MIEGRGSYVTVAMEIGENRQMCTRTSLAIYTAEEQAVSIHICLDTHRAIHVYILV